MSFIVPVLAAAAGLAVPVAAAQPPVCNGNTFPTQIRLAYAGHGGMSVSWNTKEKLPNPTVLFGKDPKNLNRQASSSISVTYTTSSTYNNHVIINGLQPDETWYYMPQCGNKAMTFSTAPNPGKKDEFSFAMIGDMGTFGPLGLSTSAPATTNPLKPGEQTTIQSLMAAKGRYKFVYHGKSSAVI